jgi:hypothetical protein
VDAKTWPSRVSALEWLALASPPKQTWNGIVRLVSRVSRKVSEECCITMLPTVDGPLETLKPQGAPMAKRLGKWTRDTRRSDCASSPHARLGQSLADAISGKADSPNVQPSAHAKVCRTVWWYQRLSYIEFRSMPEREQAWITVISPN